MENKVCFFYCGNYIPRALPDDVIDCFGKDASSASNIFYNALLDGLSENECEVYTSCFFDEELIKSSKCHYFGRININYHIEKKGIMKYLHRFFALYKDILNYSKHSEEKYIIFNVLRITSSISGLLASKLLRIKTVGIVTDVPGYRMPEFQEGGLINTLCDRIGRYILGKYDSYVLLSREMANVIPLNKKKYVIIEGIYNATAFYHESTITKTNDCFEILYAGALHYKYGIMNLVEAVRMIRNEKIKLKIYGVGDAKDEIIAIAQSDKRIVFCGFADHRKILDEEKKVHLLVNPRPVDDIYVKYSFPSKNMEYMASGTPVLFTSIPSLPEEYRDYINEVPNNDPEEIACAIRRLLNPEYYSMALKKAVSAKIFIESKKNEKTQSKKIIEMINE